MSETLMSDEMREPVRCDEQSRFVFDLELRRVDVRGR